jgi:hypothetical protein
MFRTPSDHLQAIKLHKLKLQLPLHFYVSRLRSQNLSVLVHTAKQNVKML